MFHNSSPLVVGGLFFIKKRKIMQIFPESVTTLWNEWELRVMVIFSLIFQILLILMGKSRKYSAAIWIRIILWIAYLSADWVATVSLGVLSNKSGDLKGHSAEADYVISAFWAPFLLLHLGGPDTITAYSLEDNELWLRHLLGLAVQVGVAFYVFLRAWISSPLNFLAIPIFIAGIIKFGERVWILRYTSSEHFKDSMLPNPDPGPNYARYMEEYSLKKAEGFKISSGTVIAARTEADYSDTPASDDTIPEKAFYFFQIFMLLCVDLILSFHDVLNSQSFFQKRSFDEAFKVIEVELGFMYDVFYTKAVVVYSFVYGFLTRFSLCCISLRCISFFSIISAFVAFLITEKQAYSTVDVIITYVLLVGAIVLELYAVFLLLCSDWTLTWLSKHKNWVAKFLYRAISLIPLIKKQRWSNTMAQYGLIRFCLKDKPAKRSFIPKGLCHYKLLEKHLYKYSVNVPSELKKLIFELSLEKSKRASDFNACKELCACRGDQVLKDQISKENSKILEESVEVEFDACRGDQVLKDQISKERSKILEESERSKILEESVKVEFDQSILLWHIATDLCYHFDPGENSNLGENSNENSNLGENSNPSENSNPDENSNLGENSNPSENSNLGENSNPGENSNENSDSDTIGKNRDASKLLSDYMLYLLVMCPFMLPNGIGLIRYRDTCAEAIEFFEERKSISNVKDACTTLLKVSTEIPPSEVKGDRSKSVLFDACRLAKCLQSLETEKKGKMWDLMSRVWVEMLSYAASQCRWNLHGQQLRRGGELLTHVWLLLAHLGITEQFQISQGYARAKLVVE